ALAQIPASFLQSAALSGVGLLSRLRTILAPLVAPALLSVLVAIFASSVFDLAATTMLAPPNFVTLPVEILLEYDRGHYGYATAGAIFTAAVVIVLAAVGTALGRRLIRRYQSSRTESR
ncbi:ABC transporter permease subunit, partial [Pontimonas sp.]|uniref:ABC transporter permease subunit n=1 Tax=Pontimonas sp. TaxID=2304492 RepID=UPI0028708D71